jgi:hypothetical protein
MLYRPNSKSRGSQTRLSSTHAQRPWKISYASPNVLILARFPIGDTKHGKLGSAWRANHSISSRIKGKESHHERRIHDRLFESEGQTPFPNQKITHQRKWRWVIVSQSRQSLVSSSAFTQTGRFFVFCILLYIPLFGFSFSDSKEIRSYCDAHCIRSAPAGTPSSSSSS